MKNISLIAKIILIGIFLFSGLIKLNDPIGTQLKLEEYFEVFSIDFPLMEGFWKFWIPFALPLSIILSSLEIILVVALWVNFKTKQVLISILALLIFFSFLTFYSAYFNKVTDCGCFGETIKLTPWTSFGKDIVLIFLTFLTWMGISRNSSSTPFKWVILSTFLSVGLGIYSYFYLPLKDGLAYAIGENIPQNMKAREELKFSYKYLIQGKEVELTEMPLDTTAKFVSMEAINEKEARPLITDYKIWAENDTIDYTQESFKGNKLMIIMPNIGHAKLNVLTEIGILAKKLETKGITTWLISAAANNEINEIRHEYQLGFPALSADTKVLKTMIRSNPGLWLISNGTVKGKWSAYHLPSANDIQQSLTSVQE
jgi:hypothetical protein